MYDQNIHEFCSEFYTVEKTVEVVVNMNGESKTIRIEAIKDEINGRYSTQAYMEEEVTLQPTYPNESGKFRRKPQGYSIWTKYYLPWTDRSTAEHAIYQALSFLEERCSN